jgi:hypothetical protein
MHNFSKELAIELNALAQNAKRGAFVVAGVKASYDKRQGMSVAQLAQTVFSPGSVGGGGSKPRGEERRGDDRKSRRSSPLAAPSTPNPAAEANGDSGSTKKGKRGRESGEDRQSHSSGGTQSQRNHRKFHPNAGTAEAPWFKSEEAKFARSQKPPLIFLSDTYYVKRNKDGQFQMSVMSEKIRQSLADKRAELLGQPSSAVSHDDDVPEYQVGMARRSKKDKHQSASKPSGEEILLCSENPFRQPTTTAATPCNELCVCASILNSNPNAASVFTNRVSVFVSPNPQEEAAAVGASEGINHSRAGAADTVPNCVGRLDTGASCHDFISKQLADGLIAKGAEVTPIVGRVCSAFKAVGRDCRIV